ncbi:MAG: DUF692 family protein [Myxococcales bacterium]|nr:DUF692 family protein [Myxococcales bacterium]MCB9523664.1 DUF692 family protein [Myxococcales bacterium]
MSDFLSRRVHALPHLGLGVSTEYGAPDAPGALDLPALRAEHPEWAAFLEVGVETAKGLDRHARWWAAQGWPTTYHFLDVNLDEPQDVGEPRWLDEVRGLIDVLKPAWLCGDAGLWHFGPRDRNHMLLLPPILTDDAAKAMAEGIVTLREATGLEVMPENPPGQVFLGDLHLLDFFAKVADYADTGLLLDAAHLAIYQRVCGHAPTTGLDGFPAERVLELHVAGATEREVEGLPIVEDDHTPAVLDDTWAILDALGPVARNLRAVIFECERNPLASIRPGLERIQATLAHTPYGQRGAR